MNETNAVAKGLSGRAFDMMKGVAKKVQELTQFRKPKPSCRKCHGTGREGFLNGIKELPVPCRCLTRRGQ